MKEDDGVDSEPGDGFLLHSQPGPTAGVEDDGEGAGRRLASRAGSTLQVRDRRPHRERSRAARVEGGQAEEAVGQALPGGECGQQCPNDHQSFDVLCHSVASKFLFKAL